MQRKIYLASSWKNRYRLRPVRDELQARGHIVTSGWIDVDETDYPAPVGARRDIDDLNAADTLIFWPNDDEGKTTGKYVEFGYALGAHKDVYVVQRDTSTCIFLSLEAPTLTYVNSFMEVVALLGDVKC